eukprot:scaffold27380_cov52-Cyclotella_meneghiniana.AAC.4
MPESYYLQQNDNRCHIQRCYTNISEPVRRLGSGRGMDFGCMRPKQKCETRANVWPCTSCNPVGASNDALIEGMESDSLQMMMT